jgi:hypothetical protein
MNNRNLWLGGLLALLLLAIFVPSWLPEDKGYPASLALIDTVKVDAVEFAKGDESLRLEKRNGLWRVVRPVSWAADRPAVDRMLAALSDLSVLAKVQDNADFAEDARFELDDEQALRLQVFAGGSSLLQARLGKASSDFSSGFARYEERPEIYRLAQHLGSRFSPQSSRWIDKVVMRVEPEDLAQIELERADGRLRFTNLDSLWTVDWEPASGRGSWTEAPVKDAELNGLRSSLATLRMSELAADEHLAALAEAPVVLTHRLRMSSGIEHVVEWARLPEDESRVYCRPAGQSTWFALFKSSLERLEKEPVGFRQE